MGSGGAALWVRGAAVCLGAQVWSRGESVYFVTGGPSKEAQGGV